MSEADSGPDLLDELAHEFAERFRRGERPALTEYTDRYPELAGPIRALFPALVMMEEFGSVASEPPHGQVTGAAPRQLGEYRILREIGRGGMGVVYEAVQESLGRHVALKVLPLHHLMGATHLERFEREAKAAARLHHTNIVPVFGIGVHEGVHFYAMQFIQGQAVDVVLEEVRRQRAGTAPPAAPQASATAQPLTVSIAQSLLADAPVEPSGGSPSATMTAKAATGSTAVSGTSELTGPSEAQYFRGVARLGVQVVEALAYAHRQGIVHRDIKPSNLLLDTQGIAWITDFGLVKDESASNLTNPGDIVGTIRYMAPERFKDQGDARSDIYSLGATLYEMLTLKPAFPGEGRADLIDRVRHEEPPRPRQLDARIPRDLETVVLKAMAKEPGRRYQGADELAEDLRRYLADRPVLARRTTTVEQVWRWCRRNPTVATLGAFILVLLTTLLAGAWLSNARLQAQLERAEKAEGDALRESKAARIAEQDGQRRLWNSYLAQANAGRYSGQAGQRFVGLDVLAKAAAIQPSMELRNEAIACMALADLRFVEPGEAEPSIDVVGAWGLRCVIDKVGDVVLTHKTNQTEVARLPSSHGKSVGMRISPDGAWIAVYHDVPRAANQPARIRRVIWDWRARKVVHEADHRNGTPWGWSADGSCFYYGDPSGRFRTYDMAKAREVCSVHLQEAPPIALEQYAALSPDRTKLALVGKKGSADSARTVQVFDLTTGTVAAEFVHPVVDPLPLSVWRVAWGLDSRLLACARDEALFIWDVPRKKQQAVIKRVRGDSAMVFTRVGNLLVSSGSATLTQVSDPLTGTPLVSIRGANIANGLIRERWLPRLWPTASFIELALGEECRSLSTAGRDFGPHAAFHPQVPLLALADYQGARLFDLSTMREAAFLDLGACSAVLFHRHGDLLTYTPKYGLQRWPIRRTAEQAGGIVVGPPRQLCQAPLTQTTVNWAALGSGDQVAVADWGRRQAVLLNVDRPDEKTVCGPHIGVRCMSISPDGRWLASGPWTANTINVWDTKTGQLAKEFRFDGYGAAHVLFTPDGRWLIGCLDKEYQFWKVGSWELERVVSRKESTYPGMVAVSPDGQLMALCDSLTEVKLVEYASAREIARLPAHLGRDIAGLCFSPDGIQLAVTITEGGALLWDLRAVRKTLAAMKLDWDLPSYEPGGDDRSQAPMRIQVVNADTTPPAYPVGPASPNPVLERRLALFEFIAASTPYHPEPFHQRGHVREGMGQYGAAIADYDAALAWQPGAAHLYYDRGRNYEALKDHVHAVRDFERAVALAPNYVPALNALAWLYVAGPPELRAPAKAVPLARRAVQLAAGNWTYRNTLGVALYRINDFRAAVEVLETNSKDAKNVMAGYGWLFLAQCHHRLGDQQNRRMCYDRALAWQKQARLTVAQTHEWNTLCAEAEALFAANPNR